MGTVVLYMAVENLDNIIKQMLKVGKSENTTVAIIQDASLADQKVLTGTLGNIVAQAKSNKIKPPAIIIIGDVVKLENKFKGLRPDVLVM